MAGRQAPAATLAHAPGVDTSSEAWRHACEVRFVAAMASHEARTDYLTGVAKRRGEKPAEQLRADTWALMRTTAAGKGK